LAEYVFIVFVSDMVGYANHHYVSFGVAPLFS